ncbi:MAG: DUF1538 domain-containing protein [Firmicutes bacterium]|nr:DUF1538 domain-containing protein [Bacillota bacterium]HOB35664.1 DUF1538 domain-containing protein [Bacillota bacterium]HPZ90011.1 DUF1538 domain-containing protein [Bacillota bacterium]HQE01418.1 DUF1538 domain-containing protein [Bacillota bacterium]
MVSVKETVNEVVRSVLPITAAVILLQITVVRQPWSEFLIFLFSVLMTMAGLTLFLIGVKESLLAIGELVGKSLLQSGKLWFIVAFAIAVGFAVTVAEPGVQVLANQVDVVSGGEISRYLLVAVVALGVGIYLALAMLRVIFNISLLKLLLVGYILVFALAIFTAPEFLAVSFDAGGATTGPVTVPFILSLGVGVSAIRGSRTASQDSFGFVGLGSVGPILAVLLLGVIFK